MICGDYHLKSAAHHQPDLQWNRCLALVAERISLLPKRGWSHPLRGCLLIFGLSWHAKNCGAEKKQNTNYWTFRGYSREFSNRWKEKVGWTNQHLYPLFVICTQPNKNHIISVQTRKFKQGVSFSRKVLLKVSQPLNKPNKNVGRYSSLIRNQTRLKILH